MEVARLRDVVREQVEVDRSPSEAWNHLSKLEEWPSWAGHIRRVEPSPPGGLTSSTRAVLYMKMGPPAVMTVTKYDPPRSWIWEGSSMGVTTRFEHRLEEIDDGRTRIWFLAWMSGPLAGPAGWIFGKMMHRYLSQALPKLKGEIEAAA